MTNSLQAMLAPQALRLGLFPPTSRYHGIDTVTLETPDGTTRVYLRRRLVPAPEHFAQVSEYLVQQGDRLDNLAARIIGDPEQFWRLCDANGAIRPDDLIVTGKKLRITLPDGIPGLPRG